MQKCKIGNNWLNCCTAENDVGLIANHKLNRNQQYNTGGGGMGVGGGECNPNSIQKDYIEKLWNPIVGKFTCILNNHLSGIV